MFSTLLYSLFEFLTSTRRQISSLFMCLSSAPNPSLRSRTFFTFRASAYRMLTIPCPIRDYVEPRARQLQYIVCSNQLMCERKVNRNDSRSLFYCLVYPVVLTRTLGASVFSKGTNDFLTPSIFFLVSYTTESEW